MENKCQISATIVIYNQDIALLKKTVYSFLNTPLKKKLFLIDNSKINTLQSAFIHPDIRYIFNNKNLGFGSSHNLVLNQLDSECHLILNPDVAFDSEVIPALMLQLVKEENTTFITPKVLYPNKELQRVCRKYPTFFDLINRRLKISKKLLFKKEYGSLDVNQSFYPEFIHGCFMLFKTNEFIALRGFDERYFLYMEDADICKKIDKSGKVKLYFPEVTILHQHERGSAKKLKLFFYHIASAIKYFLKWGF
jgi:hypothetical protein